jgi:hypothetical protein
MISILASFLLRKESLKLMHVKVFINRFYAQQFPIQVSALFVFVGCIIQQKP